MLAGGRTLARLSVGAPARLYIETHVREDAIRLFGFDSEEERAWFAHLQTIPGVGAKVALAILDTMPPQVLADAVALQDKAAFTRANGVGPKLAKAMRDRGVVTRAKGDSILFAPPLIITEAQIDEIVNVTGDAIELVMKGTNAL